MLIQVYSKFSKNKIWKKIKSPSTMKNGRFHPPKYRGKFQKMGCCRGTLPKSQAFAIYFLKKKKTRATRAERDLAPPPRPEPGQPLP
jgi:hypothetical protein